MYVVIAEYFTTLTGGKKPKQNNQKSFVLLGSSGSPKGSTLVNLFDLKSTVISLVCL